MGFGTHSSLVILLPSFVIVVANKFSFVKRKFQHVFSLSKALWHLDWILPNVKLSWFEVLALEGAIESGNRSQVFVWGSIFFIFTQKLHDGVASPLNWNSDRRCLA